MAQRKQTPNKATAAKQTGAPKSTPKRTARTQQAVADFAPGERDRMIAERAYLIAEQRGFEGDMALHDWLQAEAEVDARFAARH